MTSINKVGNNIKKSHRLRWACRRGMLELDLLLLPFFDNYFNQLTTQQQKDFERLLNYQDPELYGWFIGSKIPEDKALLQLVQIIKERVNVTN